jgi:hypothetical protein
MKNKYFGTHQSKMFFKIKSKSNPWFMKMGKIVKLYLELEVLIVLNITLNVTILRIWEKVELLKLKFLQLEKYLINLYSLVIII